jgi:hypothetical protein
MKKRLSVYLEEGINQMVGIFLGHYLFNKLNQEVMWRTESKQCNSTNCLRRHIWYVKQE